MSASMVDSARPGPSRLYRWTVLLFVSVAMGGNYYIYDSINPLERIFIDKLGFSATAFGFRSRQPAATESRCFLVRTTRQP